MGGAGYRRVPGEAYVLKSKKKKKKVVLMKKTLKNLEHESRKGLILRRETREISLRGASFRLGRRNMFIGQREGANREMEDVRE